MSVPVENSYRLEGSVLDVYSGVPFWFQGSGSHAESISVTTWLIDKGEVAGIGISDTPVVTITTKAPEAGLMKCRRLILVEEEAAPEVVRWVVDAFQGRLGGPLGRLAALSGDQVGFYQVPINYRLEETRSGVSVPDKLKVATSGRRIPEWHPAGSAGPWQRNWIGRGSQVSVRIPEFDMVFELPETRAVRGYFRLGS